VSELPRGWVAIELSSAVTLKTGPFGSALHQSDYVTNGVPLVNPMHIANGKIKPSVDVTVTPETVERLGEYCLREGDLVMARRGEMGRSAVVFGNESGWLCGTGSLIVRPNARLLDADFLQRLSFPLFFAFQPVGIMPPLVAHAER
jgi:type I restriction enzyme S subunit